MASTGILQRRYAKAVLIADPPLAGELVYATDTNEYGLIDERGNFVWTNLSVLQQIRVVDNIPTVEQASGDPIGTVYMKRTTECVLEDFLHTFSVAERTTVYGRVLYDKDTNSIFTFMSLRDPVTDIWRKSLFRLRCNGDVEEYIIDPDNTGEDDYTDMIIGDRSLYMIRGHWSEQLSLVIFDLDALTFMEMSGVSDMIPLTWAKRHLFFNDVTKDLTLVFVMSEEIYGIGGDGQYTIWVDTLNFTTMVESAVYYQPDPTGASGYEGGIAMTNNNELYIVLPNMPGPDNTATGPQVAVIDVSPSIEEKQGDPAVYKRRIDMPGYIGARTDAIKLASGYILFAMTKSDYVSDIWYLTDGGSYGGVKYVLDTGSVRHTWETTRFHRTHDDEIVFKNNIGPKYMLALNPDGTYNQIHEDTDWLDSTNYYNIPTKVGDKYYVVESIDADKTSVFREYTPT